MNLFNLEIYNMIDDLRDAVSKLPVWVGGELCGGVVWWNGLQFTDLTAAWDNKEQCWRPLAK